MKNFFKSFKFKALILMPIGAATFYLFLYNNMTLSSPVIKALLAESRDIQTKIDDPSFSANARSFLIAHKKVVLNVISNKMLAENCAELLSYDASMPSGKYIFYKNGNVNYPELYKCSIAQKKLTSQTFVKSLKKTSGTAAATIFYKQVTFNNSTAGNYRVNIPGTNGLPKIVKLLSSKVCKANVDYGFDANGVWVKNGCRGTFKVPLSAPLKDRFIASGTTNPNPMMGRFTFETVGTQLNIKGWACEKKKAKPVNVQIYAGGPAGVGTLVTTAYAKNSSEDAVNDSCETAIGVNHRFLAPLPLASLTKYKGKELFVHGLSSDTVGTANGGLISNMQKIFPGSNQCGTTSCSLEDPRDKQGINRFLIRNDQASLNQRCRELGYTAGVALAFYTRAEWCGYSNARTKYWNGTKWILTSCIDGNIKQARCYEGIP